VDRCPRWWQEVSQPRAHQASFDVALKAPRAHLTFSEFTRYVRCHGFAETEASGSRAQMSPLAKKNFQALGWIVNEKDETLADYEPRFSGNP
jgi:hypothetical protein